MKASEPHKFQDSFGSLLSTFRIDPKTAFYSGILFLIFPFLFFIGLILKQYL
ncbi:hypothetical protein [Gramella sp. MAR_2010_147]|uniref:hypothetical protein n=1 Tax=Gramella sp. MAR_2010_147 TaxID=1250205 RepID=UPI0012FD9B0F|nr:hypothetical protein [Gramella sp. MAR_2010_147]